MIKLFMTDVDGVLTDSGMYYSNSGEELKRFSTYDGMAIELLRLRGIKTAIITAEETEIVANRAQKVKFDYVFQGVQDKLSVAKRLCELEGFSLQDDTAYIGDDINDILLLENVKYKACPNNAIKSVKDIKGILNLETRGGHGAVREFVEILINGS